jgi:hypothetical protein
MKKILISIFITFLVMSFSTAQASVIDFDNATLDQSTGSYLDSNLDTLGFDYQGFQFSNNMNIFSAETLGEAAVSGNAVAYNDKWGESVITRNDGSSFSFSSLSIKYIQNSAVDTPTSFTISAYKNGSVFDTLIVSDMTNWTNVSVNFADIDKLVINTNNNEGNFMLDNINVTANTTDSNNIPEPESLALMLLGLPLIGWISRRRK